MASQIWTYESLAKASSEELENILRTGTAPDLEQLNGYIYCGWNHEWIGNLSGKKFKKGFKKKDGSNFGYNETVIQDKDGFRGEWKQNVPAGGTPTQLGYFRTAYVRDEPPMNIARPYPQLGFFDYDIPHMHKWYLSFFKVIRDFVVLPNPGDNSLLLCKAYLRVFPFLNIFYCYFQLGHREPIKYQPW
ncbi:MAG: hypothetical protein WB699_17080 [Bacteroidota bacterium]